MGIQSLTGKVGILIIILLLFSTAAMSVGYNRGEKGMFGGGNGSNGGICANVPNDWANVFKSAGDKYDVEPAFLAAVFAGGEHQGILSSGEWPAYQEAPAYGTSLNPKMHNCGRDASNFEGRDEDRTVGSGWGGCIRGPVQMNESNWASKGEGPLNFSIEEITPSVNAMAKMLSGTAGGKTTDIATLQDAASLYNSGKKWNEGQGIPETAKYVPRVIEAFNKYYCPFTGGECAQKVVELAMAAIGNPTSMYNADDPEKACAAFTTTILKNAGVIDRINMQAQSFWDTGGGQAVIDKGGSLNLSLLAPSDIVFFTNTYDAGRYFTHIGIYIGNDKFVNSSSSAQQIKEMTLSTYMGGDHFAGAKRFCSGATTDSSVPTVSSNTVTIDPGHPSDSPNGGTNTGTHNGSITENQVNWDVAQKTASILRAKGINIVMTKSRVDEFVTNKKRAEIANAANSALFLRIHANSEDDPENFTMYPSKQGNYNGVTGPPSSVLGPSKRAAELIANAAGSSTGKGTLGAKAESSFSGNSSIDATGGVLIGSLYSNVPTCTMEMIGMGGSSANAQWINNPSNQQKMAEGIANGVLSFLGK